MKVLVGHKILSSSRSYTPASAAGGIARYVGIDFIEGIYKDHRRLKREKRRARKS